LRANYPDALVGIVERLKGVVIENRDAKQVMATHDGPETLHYVDPPYVLSTRSDTSKDYAVELSDEDHDELLQFLRGLTGTVILSGYAHQLSGWAHPLTRTRLSSQAIKPLRVLPLRASIRCAP
jgi:DNA adenine methylase